MTACFRAGPSFDRRLVASLSYHAAGLSQRAPRRESLGACLSILCDTHRTQENGGEGWPAAGSVLSLQMPERR